MPKKKTGPKALPGSPGPRAVKIRTLEHQENFLRQFAVIHNVTQAAQLAGIDRVRHYEWMANGTKYPDYPARFEAAKQQALDHIRGAIMRRGVHGWDEPVYGTVVDQKTGKSKGTGVVGHVRKFSDKMAELAAKAHLPEFKEKLELTGPGGGPVLHQVLLATLPDDEIRARMQKALEVLDQPALEAAPEPAQLVEDKAGAYARELAERAKKDAGGNGHGGKA